MASTRSGTRLTEAHRLAQARLGAQTVAQMRALWALIDPADLDATTPRWLRTAVPVLRAQRVTSARLAANYYRTFRALELPGVTPATPRLAEAIDATRAATALTATGPAAVKAATRRGATLAAASDFGSVASARSAMRLTLDAGRSTIAQTLAGDRRALGWARVTSGRPCAFCAAIAGRGPVYGSEDTASFEAHDSCSCTAEPVFNEDAAWPPGSREYRDLYDQVAKGERDPLKAFRRAFEADAA